MGKSKNLLQIVQKLKKKELLRCAYNLGVELDEKWPLQKMQRTYAEHLLTHPRELLIQLPNNEFGLIKVYDDEVPGQMKSVYNTYIPLLIVEYGLAEIVDTSLDGIDIIVAKDLQKVLSPLIDEVLKDENKQQLSVIEIVVEGLTNLLGIVTQQEIRDYLREAFHTDSEDDLKKGFGIARQYSLLLDSMEWSEQPEDPDSENIMFASNYGWEDKAAMWQFIRQRSGEIAHPRKFTIDEVAQASSHTYPVVDSPVKDAFIDYLVKGIGMDEEQANYFYFKLWYFKMHYGENGHANELMEAHFAGYGLASAQHELSDQEAEEGMRRLKEFADNLPLWHLRGYTATDYPSEAYVSKIKEPMGALLRDVAKQAKFMTSMLNSGEGSKQDMPYFPQEPANRQEEENPWASQKIGRNDPCPCGSGLKYKKCHGK